MNIIIKPLKKRHKPVFNTIKELLSFKETTTFTEIGRIAKINSLEVIQVCNKNSGMLHKYNNGSITGFSSAPITDLKFKLGKTFRSNKIVISNDGLKAELLFSGHDELKATYNFSTSFKLHQYDPWAKKVVIPDTATIRTVLSGHGIQDEVEVVKDLDLELYWDEK